MKQIPNYYKELHKIRVRDVIEDIAAAIAVVCFIFAVFIVSLAVI